MGETFDVVIIGAGHNGLVAAGYLAKEGLKVLVLERRDIVGGACITEEFHPGFKVSTLAYAVSLLRPKIVRDLELKRHGLRIHVKDPQYFVPYPDGKHLFLWRDVNRSMKEIERFSKHDTKAYLDFSRFWESFGYLMESMLMHEPVSPSELFNLIKSKEDEEMIMEVMFTSVKDFLDERFESEHVKAALATQGIIGVYGGPFTPGTLYVMGHHAMGEIDGERDVWGYAEGGMGAITRALATSALSFGASIRLGCDVSRIIVSDARTQGVQLSTGETIQSRVVVSNADPKRTFLELLGKDNLDADFVRRVRALKSRGVAMKVNCALHELPKYDVKDSMNLGPEANCTTGIAPSIDYLERAWDDAKYGRPSREPFMEVLAQSSMDPSLAPAGKHSLSIYAQYMPYHLSGAKWDEIRHDVADRILETLSLYAPNVNRSTIYKQVITPLDLERTFSLTEGCIFHIDMSPDQLFSSRPLPGWSNYKTPIEALYLCSSGTHPGGGVIGASGYLAAKRVIRDLKGDEPS